MAVASSIIGGALALGGSAIAASSQRSAARNVANTAQQTSDDQIRLAREIYADQRSLNEPYRVAGSQAQAMQMLLAGMPREQVMAFLRQSERSQGQPPANAFGLPGGGFTPGRVDRPYRPGTGGPMPNYYGGPSEFYSADDGFPDDMPGPGSTGTTTAGATGHWLDDFDPQTYLRNTPGYQFRQQEGQRAIERSAAARGQLMSGATGRSLARYGDNLAEAEFNNAFNRLGAFSGTGYSAAQSQNAAGSAFGAQAGDAIGRAGAARASAYAAQGDANASMWNAFGTIAGRGFADWQNRNASVSTPGFGGSAFGSRSGTY